MSNVPGTSLITSLRSIGRFDNGTSFLTAPCEVVCVAGAEIHHYVLLHRAFDNAGDWLILKRAQSLLQHVRPDRRIIVGKAWEPLEKQINLDLLNGARAILIAGGPGYVHNMYPGVYPLTSNLSSLRCPIVTIGCGWNAWPGHISIVRKYRFSPQAMSLLRKMNSQPYRLGVRGVLTNRVLQINGVTQATLVGDPAWYDIGSLGRPFQSPGRLSRIIFTPPVDAVYHSQGKKLLGLLRSEFPTAEIVVSLHATVDRFFGEAAKNQGYGVMEISGTSSNNIKFYRDFDLHVGYRLHAHPFFLSIRKPSYLVAEDFRGLESLLTLGLFGLSGWNAGIGARLPLFEGHIYPSAVPLVRKFLLDREVPELLLDMLKDDLQNHFSRFSGLGTVLDNYYEHRMKPFLLSLP